MTRSRSRKRKTLPQISCCCRNVFQFFRKNWRVKMTHRCHAERNRSAGARPQARIWRGSGRRLSGRDWRMRAILAENPGMGKENRTGARRAFSHYERLLCSRQDGNRRKNLLRAAELALPVRHAGKAEQYLNEAAEILGMEEDIFYQQIRKRWEEAG